MKKFLFGSFVLVMVLFLSFHSVIAETAIDLSGMTYDELVALKDKINLAIWNSEEWQEVTVPQGLWKVGEDIPAGHWTIKCAGGYFTFIRIGTIPDNMKKDVKDEGFLGGGMAYNPTAPYKTAELLEIDFELEDGMYVAISCGPAIFSPYAGKPDLGFK